MLNSPICLPLLASVSTSFRDSSISSSKKQAFDEILFTFYMICLDSSFVPPLVYAVLGSSRDLAVGPVSIASLILGSMLGQEVSPTKDPLLFLQLAFTTTFFAGVVQASLGFLRWKFCGKNKEDPFWWFNCFRVMLYICWCRLGFIIDFLSKAILVGFMAGAAIIVSLQQLKSLLGITHFTKQMGLVPVMSSVFHTTNEVQKKSLKVHQMIQSDISLNKIIWNWFEFKMINLKWV